MAKIVNTATSAANPTWTCPSNQIRMGFQLTHLGLCWPRFRVFLWFAKNKVLQHQENWKVREVPEIGTTNLWQCEPGLGGSTHVGENEVMIFCGRGKPGDDLEKTQSIVEQDDVPLYSMLFFTLFLTAHVLNWSFFLVEIQIFKLLGYIFYATMVSWNCNPFEMIG